MDTYLKHAILFVVSFLIVGAGLFILSAPMKDKESLAFTSFGYPLPFLYQDLSLIDGHIFFPGHYEFSFDFKKFPLSGFSFSYFIVDFLIIFGIIEVIVFLLEKGKGFFVDRRIWPYSRVD